jgi:hypothetical protein
MAAVQIWINAFIPRSVPGYTQTLTTGKHAGKTAVPLPGVARLWPGNTLKDWNAGYLTDQRSFDSSPSAGRRMQSLAEVDLSLEVLTRQAHTSSGTTEVNLSSGDQTGFAVADMSRCSFTQLTGRGMTPTSPGGGGGGAIFGAARGGSTMPTRSYFVAAPGSRVSMSLELAAAAADPLVGMAADIDYTGTITITGVVGGAVTVAYNGLLDSFPAYDCYASYNGATKVLFTSSPPPGNTVSDLLGPPNRPISASVTF